MASDSLGVTWEGALGSPGKSFEGRAGGISPTVAQPDRQITMAQRRSMETCRRPARAFIVRPMPKKSRFVAAAARFLGLVPWLFLLWLILPGRMMGAENGTRTALVIGNDRYESAAGTLRNSGERCQGGGTRSAPAWFHRH